MRISCKLTPSDDEGAEDELPCDCRFCVVGVCLCLFFVFWFFVLVSPAADYSKSRLPGAASIGLNAATANFQPEIAVSRAR